MAAASSFLASELFQVPSPCDGRRPSAQGGASARTHLVILELERRSLVGGDPGVELGQVHKVLHHRALGGAHDRRLEHLDEAAGGERRPLGVQKVEHQAADVAAVCRAA